MAALRIAAFFLPLLLLPLGAGFPALAGEKRIGPVQEAGAAKARERQWKADYARWRETMPPCLRPLWPFERYMEIPDEAGMEPLRKALAGAVPDPRERALILFAWHGSGMGPWSGYPAYENAAECLLLDLPVPVLIAAAEAALNERQMEGAARLFAGWGFYTRHGRPALPEALGKKLLEHSLQSSDADRIERAKRAFAPE